MRTSSSTSDQTRNTETRHWFTSRRASAQADDRHDRSELEFHALALAVGYERAAQVRSLLTPVSVGSATTAAQQLRLPRQAFFVLSGRLAITVADRPVAVLGPGSFFGESDSTRVHRPDVPRIHALGNVVLGVAEPDELSEIHRLVPDLPTFTMAAAYDDMPPDSLIDDNRDEVDDDVMGLGLLERIAS